MKYTNNKPTKPGDYYFRYNRGGKIISYIVTIVDHKGVLIVDDGNGFGTPLDEYCEHGGEFAGPITPPEE